MHNLFLYLLIVILIITPSFANAQVHGGKHQKLFDLFAFEKYEDCAFKALSMSENDKYRRDPEIYLYLSMTHYEISKMDPEDLDEEYKAPIQDALKYAAKYAKKDKEKEFWDGNKNFFDNLKTAGIKEAQNWDEQGKARKAASTFGRIVKYDPDPNVRFAKGFCDIKAQNSQGALEIKAGLKEITKNYKDPNYKPDNVSEPVLIETLVNYTKYLEEQQLLDSAKIVITLARDLMNENEKIEAKYNKVYNIETKEEKKPEEKNGMKIIYEQHSSEESSNQETE